MEKNKDLVFKKHKDYKTLGEELISFLGVGSTGFIVNIVIVWSMKYLIGLYPAVILGFLCSATNNWFLNRLWTFRKKNQKLAKTDQWLRFLLVASFGFIIYLTIFHFCYNRFIIIHKYPTIGITIASIAVMLNNFLLSRKLVFL